MVCLWFPAGRLRGGPPQGGAIANGHAEDGVAAAGRDAVDGDGGSAAGGRLALPRRRAGRPSPRGQLRVRISAAYHKNIVLGL